MNAENSFKKLMRAIALGHASTAQSLSAGLSNEEHGALGVYSTAVMSVCLEQRFPDGFSREAIWQFVNEMRQNFANAATPIKPFATEGVIRAFAGEEHLLDEISNEDQLACQYPVIRKIVGESAELQARIDDILNDAELLVAEWEKED